MTLAHQPATAVREQVQVYLRHLQAERQLSAHTVEAYRRDLSDLCAFLDEYFGSDEWSWAGIDRLAIRAFLSHLTAASLQRRTIARKLSAVRSYFRFLHREGAVAANPARQVRAPRHGRVLPGYLTQKEMNQLFDLAAQGSTEAGWRGTRDRALVELLYTAGLRLSEAHSLSVADLESAAGKVKVHGKIMERQGRQRADRAHRTLCANGAARVPAGARPAIRRADAVRPAVCVGARYAVVTAADPARCDTLHLAGG